MKRLLRLCSLMNTSCVYCRVLCHTSFVSFGKWTFWKIWVLFCWTASSSTRWGGNFLGCLLRVKKKQNPKTIQKVNGFNLSFRIGIEISSIHLPVNVMCYHWSRSSLTFASPAASAGRWQPADRWAAIPGNAEQVSSNCDWAGTSPYKATSAAIHVPYLTWKQRGGES